MGKEVLLLYNQHILLRKTSPLSQRLSTRRHPTMPSNATPVRDSIRQINADAWIIGGRIFLARTHTPPNDSGSYHASWSDGGSAFFTVSDIKHAQNNPIASTKPIIDTGPVQLVHDAGDCNAVWRIGEAFCKVQDRFSRPETTREHATLACLHDHEIAPLSFPVPRVLYHAEFDGRYYLIVTRLPGETLEKAWPTMNEDSKKFCVDRIVAICKELNSSSSSNNICGIDGCYLDDRWLIPGPAKAKDHSPASFLRHSNELGMDCSDLVLHHCDMGPQNVIVELDKKIVGVIDWEMAGFVPRDWVRTKFCVSWAMDFDFPGEDAQLSKDWRERVQVKLGQEGYHEVGQAWRAKWNEAYANWKPE